MTVEVSLEAAAEPWCSTCRIAIDDGQIWQILGEHRTKYHDSPPAFCSYGCAQDWGTGTHEHRIVRVDDRALAYTTDDVASAFDRATEDSGARPIEQAND